MERLIHWLFSRRSRPPINWQIEWSEWKCAFPRLTKLLSAIAMVLLMGGVVGGFVGTIWGITTLFVTGHIGWGAAAVFIAITFVVYSVFDD